jgi:hypothetical protein
MYKTKEFMNTLKKTSLSSTIEVINETSAGYTKTGEENRWNTI